MLKSRFLNIFIIFFTVSNWAQDKPVDIIVEQSKDTLSFWGVNNTELTHEVTLEIVAENLLGYDKAITAFVPASDSVVLKQLVIQKGKHWKYDLTYNYKQKPSEQELLAYNANIKQEIFRTFEVDKNPLILFYREGCSRSKFAKETLERRKIPFKLINTSANAKDSDRLSQLIQIKNPGSERYLLPVFLDHQALIYDIKDLKGYMKGLVKKYK